VASVGDFPARAPQAPLTALTAPLVASVGDFPARAPQAPLTALTAPLVASVGCGVGVPDGGEVRRQVSRGFAVAGYVACKTFFVLAEIWG
jgi:hypothetical protein